MIAIPYRKEATEIVDAQVGQGALAPQAQLGTVQAQLNAGSEVTNGYAGVLNDE